MITAIKNIYLRRAAIILFATFALPALWLVAVCSALVEAFDAFWYDWSRSSDFFRTDVFPGIRETWKAE